LFYAAGTLFFGMGALAMGPIIGARWRSSHWHARGVQS
jgi:hypothetical protein